MVKKKKKSEVPENQDHDECQVDEIECVDDGVDLV